MHRISRAALIAGLVLLAGCDGAEAPAEPAGLDPDVPPVTVGDWARPAVDATWQWQLAGTVVRTYDADVVDVDLVETPDATIREVHARGALVLCYFSAGSSETYRDDAGGFAPADLGRALDGYPDERWLDIRSASVLRVMLARLDRAAARGCDGVEPDNVDGYTNRTGFDLTARDQLAFNRTLANAAHQRGLAVALKNSGDQAAELVAYYDMSVSEQCHQFEECDQLRPFVVAGKPVLNAEYPGSLAAARALAPALCPEANAAGLRTLILPVELDDAWRVACF